MFALGTGESTGQIINSLSNDGAIIITAQYSIDECGQGMHYHENPQICFLFQGRDVERRDNHLYERKTGDIYFYHAGEKHGAISRQNISKNTVIEFEEPFLRKYSISEALIEKAVKNNLDAKFLILKMQQEMSIKDSSSNLTIQTLLLNLIEFSQKSPSGYVPKWVRRLEQLLHDRWNEQLTLDELSLATGTHPVTISKYFRKYFACTLGEYQRKLKIEKSLALIKNSPLSLTEIAFHCGFADQSHFTRNFKELTGFRPKEFRKI